MVGFEPSPFNMVNLGSPLHKKMSSLAGYGDFPLTAKNQRIELPIQILGDVTVYTSMHEYMECSRINLSFFPKHHLHPQNFFWTNPFSGVGKCPNWTSPNYWGYNHQTNTYSSDVQNPQNWTFTTGWCPPVMWMLVFKSHWLVRYICHKP